MASSSEIEHVATLRASCHYGMCRHWTGSAFATLVWFDPLEDVAGKGTSVVWSSSPIARRSHCGRCGTPLALMYDGRPDIRPEGG